MIVDQKMQGMNDVVMTQWVEHIDSYASASSSQQECTSAANRVL